jgi:stalled ribosome alternative rescue factor ArfA
MPRRGNKKKPKDRNVAAASLGSPLFRQRRVALKTAYTRKSKHQSFKANREKGD